MSCKAFCVTGTVLLCVSFGLGAPVAIQYSQSVDWLTRYGYLSPPDPRTGLLQTKEGLHRALRQMQRFAGLNETGELDSATLFLMSTPRCSLPDVMGTGDLRKKRRRRRKRYALSGLQWNKTNLTWSVESYPSPSTFPPLQPEVVVLILTYALKAWGDVTPLHFHPLPHRGAAGGARREEGDIRVSFARSFHNDGYPFDSKGGTLAHAFFPGQSDLAGDVHFDDEEAWTYPGLPRFHGSTDLFTVAVHEFGHALGLSHSSSDASIMRPYYQGPVGDISSFTLPEDDRLGIQMLYGNRGRLMTPPPDPATPSLPRPPNPPSPRPTKRLDPSHLDRCEGGYDAVANIRGEVFFFKGPYFWRVQHSGSLVSLSPALICNFWKGLPREIRRIDAVYERKSDSRIVFFIGDQYWVFKDTSPLPGYPRPLSDWGLLSGDGRASERVGAAFVWAHNGKTYLFSGGEFWRFDEGGRGVRRTLNTGYPRPTSLWGGVPADPDDIMSWTDGDTYFFKNNSYWVVKSGGLDHETVTPKSIAVDWMRCPPPSTPTQLSGSCNPSGWKCNCTSNRTVLTQASHWLIVFSLTLIFWSLLTH